MSASRFAENQYEVTAEYPHEQRNEWLLTFWWFSSGRLVASCTSHHQNLWTALGTAYGTMQRVAEELDATGQLLMDQSDCLIRYGDGVIRA